MDEFSKKNNENLFKTGGGMPGHDMNHGSLSGHPSAALNNLEADQILGQNFTSTAPINPDAQNPFTPHPQSLNTPNNIAAKKVYCAKHKDKEIEYYCKLCHAIVCPKCMFLDHNGHELAQLEDVSAIIKQNIHDLKKLLMNTKRINGDKRNYVVYLKKEVDRLREVQLRNIDQGFAALIKRMEDKRDKLKEEFMAKYTAEGMEMYNKITHLDKYGNDISNIEIVYEELYKFVNKNIDAKVCAKINDISSFISKSIEDLEKIAKSKGFDKTEAFIKPDLKPLTLNVDKAYEIIGKFNLISSKSGKKPQPQAPEPREVQNMGPPMNNRFEEFQPSPIQSQNNRDFMQNMKVSPNDTDVQKMDRRDYEDYERVSMKNANFSTKARKEDYESQIQMIPEEYSSYDRSAHDGYRDQRSMGSDSQNIALKSPPNALDPSIMKASVHPPEYEDAGHDIRDIEKIQQELIKMEINDNNHQ